MFAACSETSSNGVGLVETGRLFDVVDRGNWDTVNREVPCYYYMLLLHATITTTIANANISKQFCKISSGLIVLLTLFLN